MANTRLQRTFSQAATSTKKGTFSFWMKRASISGEQDILASPYGSGRSFIRFESSGQMYATINNASDDSITNRLFKDTSAWYHIVLAIDLTQSTSTDRLKFYVNGDLVTSYSSQNPPSSSETISWGQNGKITDIGYDTTDGGAGYFDGSLSHIHWIDGTAYDASYFGETDATTGEWKIKTEPSVSYGTNGFFILKDGNSVTDQSPNTNNFSISVGAGGGLNKTEDSPSNSFCTWNPLYRSARRDMTLTYGNTFLFEQNSGDSSVSGTIAVSSGKYYWEQIIAQVNGTNAAVIGAMHTTEDYNVTPTDCYSEANTFGLRANGNAYKNGTNLGNFTTADPNGDIFGIAFDADNGNVYYWRNGVALNSGNAVITGIDTTKTWIPFAIQHGGARVTTSTNFGNGYFANNPISSAGTNASGNGIFEHDVPTGFTALSTKGLNL